MKKTLFLLMALLMTASLMTACTTPATPTTALATTASAVAKTAAPIASATTEATATPAPSAVVAPPVTVSWFWKEGGDIQVPEDSYIVKKILKDINVKYVHIAPVGMDFNEKLSTLMAAQEVPDIIESYNVQTTNLRNYGVIIPVEQYLTPDRMGNVIKSQNNWDLACTLTQKADGHMWAVPATFPANQAETTFIRYDWLKNLGLEAPKTYDELKIVLEAFTKNDPDKNKKADTVGTILTGGISYGYDTNFAAKPGSWYKDANGNATMGMFLPRTKDFLKYMKSLIDSGAVDKEIATSDPTKLENGLKSGKVGFAFNYNDIIINDDMKKVDPNADWRPMPPPKGVYSEGYINGGGIMRNEYCVSTKANVDAVFKLMNYMAEDSSTPQKLDFTGAYWEVSYGQKGLDWDVTADGKFDLGNYNAAIKEQLKIDNYVGRCRRWRTICGNLAVRSSMRQDQIDAANTMDTYKTEIQIPLNDPMREIVSEGVELTDVVAKFSDNYANVKWQEFYMRALLGKVDIDTGWAAFVTQAEKDGLKDINTAATDTFKKLGKLK